MSDRAPAQVTFYRIDPADEPAIIEWLNEWTLGPDWEPTSSNETVQPHQSYGDPETRLSVMLDGAGELEQAAPGSVWQLTQDAYCETSGEHHTYVPELGAWHGLADNDGTPVFTRDEIMRAVMTGPDGLDQLTGGPWLRVIEQLTADRATTGTV